MAQSSDKPSRAAAADPAPRRRGLWLLLGASCVLIAVGGVVAVVGMSGKKLTPAEELQLALTRLDLGRDASARGLAVKLLDSGFVDPVFPGGPNYILGIVAAREAAEMDEQGREKRQLAAVAYLREADHRGVPLARRPEWAYRLGVCLHQLGSGVDARSLLEEAVRVWPAGRTESSLLLADTYLYLRQPELMQKALELNSEVIKQADLTLVDQDRAYLQRAQLLLATGKRQEAEQALTKISGDIQGNQGTVVLRSQALMAEGKFREALQMLLPVAEDAGLERAFPRQAAYLIGICAERLGDFDVAIGHYERTAQRYERSHEALAANLRAADILRQLNRHEEALEHYSLSLRMVRKADQFRNRWIDADAFRKTVETAWQEWTEEGLFAEAIALAEQMPPLFAREQANEFGARAHQRWAAALQTRYDHAPESERRGLLAELRIRWNASGRAYAQLAQSRPTSPAYASDLWQSARQFSNGHDYARSLEQLDLFIATNPARMLPAALVQRGHVLRNMEKSTDALAQFQEVAQNYPTDPMAFEARLMTGVCALELADPVLAEKSWQGLLNAPELTPSAREWQLALLALAKLHFERGEASHRAAAAAERAGQADVAGTQAAQAFDLWTAATAEFSQYLDRYPESPERLEARYLHAKSAQRGAEHLRQKLASAETDNARADLRRKIQQRLETASLELHKLQEDLRTLGDSDRLDPLTQTLLRNSYFDQAYVLYQLARYEEAIAAYSSAATRYQLLPETLTAYVQMANCYERLGKPAEARSMLEQARVIHDQIPPDAYRSQSNGLSRDDWSQWLEWAKSLPR